MKINNFIKKDVVYFSDNTINQFFDYINDKVTSKLIGSDGGSTDKIYAVPNMSYFTKPNDVAAITNNLKINAYACLSLGYENEFSTIKDLKQLALKKSNDLIKHLNDILNMSEFSNIEGIICNKDFNIHRSYFEPLRDYECYYLCTNIFIQFRFKS